MEKTSFAPKLFSVQSVTTLITWLFILTTIGVICGVLFFFQSMNNIAKADSKRRVGIALSIEKQRQEDILAEYSYWDESYDKTITDYDQAWIEENIGLFLINRYGYDFTLAIRPDMTPAFIATKEETAPINFQFLMGQGLYQLIKETQRTNTLTHVTSSYLALLDGTYLITVGPFIDELTKRPKPDHTYLVFGKKLDSNLIKRLSTAYELPGLQLMDEPQVGRPDLPLTNHSEKAIVHLTWDIPTPTEGILPKLLAVVIVFFVILGILIRLILNREHADRNEYEKALYQMATKDALTSINNHRHFMEMSRQEFAIHKRNNRMLSVMMLDLDHFKSINDTHGHAIGDQALIHFCNICKSNLREAEIFGRVGGEEFAITLPDTGLDRAAQAGERLRQELEETTRAKGSTLPPMTVSIGIATMTENILFSNMISNADIALYQAKNNGRNRVEVFDDPKQTR